ncbi:hypothetical protein FB567DRAFT_321785 [Paraphoma chrysanthemicola]|uniref:Uncharacterized protein n=1 Tax=Paraphoma chrysanthemicola TaxID=798071 RepID=A0A8K0R831_9PLEO|nr:hypothetical protein FB567DRAFT_321785 [Paraphoma chrysanthemicola]
MLYLSAEINIANDAINKTRNNPSPLRETKSLQLATPSLEDSAIALKWLPSFCSTIVSSRNPCGTKTALNSNSRSLYYHLGTFTHIFQQLLIFQQPKMLLFNTILAMFLPHAMEKSSNVFDTISTDINIVPNPVAFTVSAFDKIGFDLDVIGRQREISRIEETERSKYELAGMDVNIIVWNMHVPEDHHFDDILYSGQTRMGRGGGFRVVVFRGEGYLRNKGALGLDNWRCSGNHAQSGNECLFRRSTQWKAQKLPNTADGCICGETI